MKENKNKVLIVLSLLSFLTIGGILMIGEMKKKSLPVAFQDNSLVLGETIQSLPELRENNPVNKIVQNTIETARDTASQKAVDLEKTIVSTVEKEIANFTKSQMDALKLQICRDWGIIGITPTPTP